MILEEEYDGGAHGESGEFLTFKEDGLWEVVGEEGFFGGLDIFF